MRKVRQTNVGRRRFVQGAAAGAVALTFPIRRVLGANEAINVGFVGLGGRGASHTKWFSEISDVRVAGLCDPDQKILANQKKLWEKAKDAEDLRKIIDDKDVDAIVIATCNHWHALSAIWAMQAGKDVYCEKPVSNNVWEGRKIVEAARKYNRICQAGTQQRSDPVQPQIKKMIESGELGKMQWIRGNRFGFREPIGKIDKPLTPPKEVNYDLWLGPAQDLPIHRPKLHYDWHWVWNTGSGEMGNWGVHILDDIRNMLFDKVGLPKRIAAGGGRVAWDDAGETPNVHYVYFDTGIVPVIFSLTNLPAKPGTRTDIQYRGTRSGFVIQFENGYYAGGRNGGWTYDNAGKRLTQFKGDGGEGHARNFIEGMKKRDPKVLNADIEQGHYSSSWCHLANAAFQLGTQYTPEKARELAKDFKPWQELNDQFEEHLKANEVALTHKNLKASAFLEIDPEKETFVGPSATPEALKLLTREYRKPYVVPDKV